MNAPAETVLDTIAADIHTRGWSVQRNFLSPTDITDLRSRVLAWRRGDEFRPAAVGRGASRRLDPHVRGDHVRWLDFSVGGLFRDVYDTWYEPLRLTLNRTMYLGLFDLEAHVTIYPPESYYVRHLDRFLDASHRTVSVILYLNDEWQPEDGGQLRLYLPQPDGGEVMHDVWPEAGTLVTFLSGDIPHEVMPTHRERISFTGWFCTRS